ncbi:hypothetical protein ACEQPO_13360 [Bacillus sp. SL00103]
MYQHLRSGMLVRDERALKEIITNIVKLGEKLNKPVRQQECALSASRRQNLS